jgi:type IV pilus assembly protein PilM
MLKSKSFLCLDFGAGSLKAAEFEVTESNSLYLRKFGVKSLGLEGSQEAAREGALTRGLQELTSQSGLSAKNLNACAPGYHVFSKFVKLPPVDTSKVTQIIQYEAQQNVPFPLEEVVWDYQITGNTPTGELEVFLVAIKSDIVEGLFRTAEAAGLRLQLVEVSPAALCNAFRYNYPDLEGCTMLLDIGAKTSNVLFFEKGKYSSRGINIGANSITQDFAAETRMPFAKAEQFKISEGFVSLGGAYEEPENPQQAQISKIARQVMTRLHIQVNQTIQFYRGQQGGAAPQRLLLAGGASIMPYTAQFFSEKLNLPVEYFNPLRNIQIDPAVNLEELAKVAHSYGEVVGLGLRSLAQCPIELNLMPKTIRKRQQFNQKKPYFIATAASIVLALLSMGWFYNAKIVAAKVDAFGKLDLRAKPLRDWDAKLAKAKQDIDKLRKDAGQLSVWLEDRIYWIGLLTELRSALMATEAKMEDDLRAQKIRAGVWIEKMTPDVPGEQEQTTETQGEQAGISRYRMSPEMLKRYRLVPTTPEPAEGAPAAPKVSTNEVVTVKMNLTAVNMHSTLANRQLMKELERQLQSRTNLFIPAETILDPTFDFKDPEDSDNTFPFGMVIKLRRPIKI